jgi:ATP-dependent Clp protease ATP-binding subunit ClpB
VSEEALRFVADAGYDPHWGARPLKRAIQRHIENPLSREILGGAFAEGDTVRVELRDGALVFLK